MNTPVTDDTGLDSIPAKEATASDPRPAVLDAVERHPRNDRRVSWEWNTALLLKTLVVVVIGGGLLSIVYVWQSNRLSQGLLKQAETAAAAGDSQAELKWLNRYVQLVPNDVPSLIKLALLENDSATTAAERDNARRRLSLALAACGEDSLYAEKREELREKLIDRLLQLGRIGAIEAENQVLKLDAPPRDPQASKWLAQTLLAQQTGNQFQQRDSKQFAAETDYWKWFVNQPVGEVLFLALEANPNDLELAASLVAAYASQPEFFNAPGQPADRELVKQRVEGVVERLKTQTSSGRAQLIAYAYLTIKTPPAAATLLLAAHESAILRIQAEFANQTTGSSSATAAKEGEILETLASSTSLPGVADQRALLFWDWTLCLEACRLLTQNGEVDPAKTLYEKLLACDSDRLSREQREATYVRFGQLLLATGDPSAIEVWSTGSQRITESLELIGLLAMGYVSEQNVDAAREQLAEFERVIALQRKRLDGPLGVSLSSAAKQAIDQRLEAAAWEALVLQCQVALLTQDYRVATPFAERAFADPQMIADAQRVRAGSLLAECYKQQQLWDMMGQVLDRCIALMPNNQLLRRQAAEAWKNAGAADRATQQLQTLDDGSFSAAIEIARLTAFGEAAKPQQQADRQAVSNAINEARRRYASTPLEQQGQLELWRLELLEYAMTSISASTSTSTSTTEEASPESGASRLDRMEELAMRYPNVLDVQIFAATNLAAEGRTESADKCLQRLDEIARISGTPLDLASAIMAKASVLAAAGDSVAAIALLEGAIPTLTGDKLRVANLAANIALKAGSTEDAYRILKLVPREALDIEALMTLASIVNMSIAKQPQDKEQLLSELTIWTKQIRAIEGADIEGAEEGTHWRLIEAEQLLNDYAVTQKPQLLEQASKLFREIDVRRPRWGRAAALGGQIASGQGLSDDAIQLYRRALRDGDNRVRTIMQLVGELRKVGRFDQAQEELKRLAGISESIFPFSELSISLALGSGSYAEAISEARVKTLQQPDVANHWRLLAQTILATLQTPTSQRVALDQPALLAEGWSALEKALELPGDNPLQIWDDRIRFRLATTGIEAATAELLAFEQARPVDEQSLLLAARWYLELKDFEQARDRAEKAVAVNPQSSNAHLVLADLHSRTGNALPSLSALRKAQAAAPSNQALREQLAMALALNPISDPQERESRLEEIDALLASIAENSSYRSRLVKAFIDLSAGNEQRKNSALGTLREIAAAPSADGFDAKRVLANHYASQWLAIPIADGMSPEATRLLADAFQLYSDLARATNPAPLDLAAYVDLLLKAVVFERQAGNDGPANTHLNEAKKLLDKLASLTGSSVATLQLSIRLALAEDESTDIQPIVKEWIRTANLDNDSELDTRLAEVAGRTLSEMGLIQQALVWLEQVYQQDPSKAQSYVVGLAQAKQFDEAIALCVTAFQQTPSADLAALIPEVVMLKTDFTLSAAAEETLRAAMTQFENSPALLEAVATLRLMQERFPEAVGLFQQIERNTVERVRTLNNLAIALAEMPMGKNEALTKIDRAIELQGKIPELLDTRGIVLLRLGRFDEARQDFEQAIKRSNDVRFKLHLAQAAMGQKDLAAANKVWSEIDPEQLNQVVLNTQERNFVQQMKQQPPGDL